LRSPLRSFVCFVENGDRTNRKRGETQYVIVNGYPEIRREVEKKLAFPLPRLPLDQCEPRNGAIQLATGVFNKFSRPQLYRRGYYRRRMNPKQMPPHRDVAVNYGRRVRLTVGRFITRMCRTALFET